MKISEKDLWAGGWLILIALIGLYINGGLFGIGLESHNLGSARRMGPGYMPMLTFWLLFGIACVILFNGFTGGPDPMERWTRLDLVTLGAALASGLVTWQVMRALGITESYREVGLACLVGLLVISISPGWRPLGMPLASYAIFALLLEPMGLMISIAALCVVAAFADREHRPLGVAGMVVFLCALCWFVFIRELDIRVPVWPTVF